MESYEENEDKDRSKTSASGLKVFVYNNIFEQKPHLYLFERRDKLTGSTVCHVDIASQEGLGEAGQESGVQQICLHEVYNKALIIDKALNQPTKQFFFPLPGCHKAGQ